MKALSQHLLAGIRISVLFALVPDAVYAAGKESAPGMPIGSPDLMNVGGGLFFVVLAIIVLGVVYARTQGLKAGTNGVINVVATQAIGPKERIAIVEVADQQILIGMTATSVQTLHVFDEPVAFATPSRAAFSDRLKMAMGSLRK